VKQTSVSPSLKDAFYSYGELKSIRVVLARNCAFVTFTTRAAAESAAAKLAHNLEINGIKLRLMWGKPAKVKEVEGTAVPAAVAGAGAASSGGDLRRLAGGRGEPASAATPMMMPLQPGMGQGQYQPGQPVGRGGAGQYQPPPEGGQYQGYMPMPMPAPYQVRRCRLTRSNPL
jgi:pre-mRNA-splicing factor RBM22/SLT11